MRKITKLFEEKLSKLNWLEWIEVLFHPLLLPFTLIPAWIKSLWASRILLWGQWSRYHGFNAQNAINSLYYRTQWINIERYGRLGNSPIVGLGDFPLSNWWYLSLLSSYFYSHAGAVTTLLGSLFIVFSHLLWIQTTNGLWVGLVTIILLLSSTIYAMAFSRQNYQILAWMFIPVALYGLLNNQLVIASIAFFLASIMGVTAFVVSSFLVIVYAIDSANVSLLLIMLPAAGMMFIKLLPLFFKGNLRNSFLNIGKLIGLVHVAVRYKRKSMRLNQFNIYVLLLHGLAIVFIWFGKAQMPVFLISSYFLFIVNQLFVRFADEQSMIMTLVLAAAIETLLAPFQWFTLVGLLIASNPMPTSFGGGSYAKPKIFAPFDVNPILSKMRSFLAIAPNTRVLFAFDDPEDEYEKIFDGYRVLLELPLVIAAEKEVHLFPDWYAVYETNYNGAPEVWGRSIDDVEKNISFWKAEYVIVYQDAGTNLASAWHNSFEVVSELDWQELLDTETAHSLILSGKKPPKWWLLKKM